MVDEDELEGLGVGVDVVPLDGVGLGQIPLGLLLGLGDLESCRYDAVSECLGHGVLASWLLPAAVAAKAATVAIMNFMLTVWGGLVLDWKKKWY